MADQKQKKRRKRRRWPWVLLALFILMLGGAAFGAYAGYLYFSKDLPRLDQLSDYRPSTISRFFAADGSVIAEYYKERREVVPLSRMPQHLVNAFVAAEDAKFFEHQGISLKAILRAAIRNLEAGRIVQGGSTITQQVCKYFLLTPEKSYRRKIREAILAYRINSKFTKNEILYLYLNQIYLGESSYGVQTASQGYFGKNVEELTLAECATLAGLPQAPSRYSPRTNPEAARERQLYVLNRMVEEGYITSAQAQEAARERIIVKAQRPIHLKRFPYFCDYVKTIVEAKYGAKALLEDGLMVYTSIDPTAQEAAEKAVAKGLVDLDRREGYRGPLKQLPPEQVGGFIQKLQQKTKPDDLDVGAVVAGVVREVGPERAYVHLGHAEGVLPVDKMRWARKPNPQVYWYASKVTDIGQILAPGDVILVVLEEKGPDGRWKLALEQEPKGQSGLVCMEAATGHIKAMVGGRDYNRSVFNRATQARRQPGSAFKTFIFAAAMDKGYTPSTIILDSAVVYTLKGTGKVWKPRNYHNKFYGPTTLRVALEKSRNVVSVKLLEQLGVDYVIEYAKRLGVKSEMTPNLSLALGACETTVLEMAESYSTFCNLGLKTKANPIVRVEDRNGAIIEEPGLDQELVIDPKTAFIISSILEGVVTSGTGVRIKALKRPAAGKTGTTNDLRDAWFVGYTPDLITSVWVGHDDHTTMGRGETGARAAIPIWLEFMKVATSDRPVRSFEAPEGMAFVRVDKETGLLAGPHSKKVITEVFKPGTAPTKVSPSKAATNQARDFLKEDLED